MGLLSAPNVSVLSTNTAAAGTKSARVRWQFIDAATNNWLRLTTSGASPVQNPQVNLIEPISLKLLLLRPGDPVPPPPPPAQPGTLSIQRLGNAVVLSWTGSYPLQSSGSVNGGWSDVGITTGPYTNTLGTSSLFFRLRSN